MSALPAEKLSLYDLEADRRALLDELEAAGGQITPEMEARWAALDQAILDKVDAYGWIIKRLESESVMFNERIIALHGKVSARSHMITRLKDRMRDYLVQRGLKKLEGADYSVRLQEMDAVAIGPNVEVPARFLRFPPPEPRKDDLKRALKAGEQIEGVSLEKRQFVVLR